MFAICTSNEALLIFLWMKQYYLRFHKTRKINRIMQYTFILPSNTKYMIPKLQYLNKNKFVLQRAYKNRNKQTR